MHVYYIMLYGCSSYEPYHELPLPVKKLRAIVHFRVGTHSLPTVPRHLRRCTFCTTGAMGDKRHCVYDCPHFQGLWQQHADILHDFHDAIMEVFLVFHAAQGPKICLCSCVGHCH